MTETTNTDNVSRTIETGWANPPSLKALKENYEDARAEHDIQQLKIDE